MTAALNTFGTYQRGTGRVVESIDRARGGQVGASVPIGAGSDERIVHSLGWSGATIEEWRALWGAINQDGRRGTPLEFQPPGYADPVLCTFAGWSAAGDGSGRLSVTIELEEV